MAETDHDGGEGIRVRLNIHNIVNINRMYISANYIDLAPKQLALD